MGKSIHQKAGLLGDSARERQLATGELRAPAFEIEADHGQFFRPREQQRVLGLVFEAKFFEGPTAASEAAALRVPL